MQYSDKIFRNILAGASDTLRQAGVTRIWIDTSGSGWTECFTVYIEAASTLIKQVEAINFASDGTRIPSGKFFDRAYLSNEIKTMMQIILVEIDLGDRLLWAFEASQNENNLGVAVWPPSVKRKIAEDRIKELEAEIAELKNIEK